MRPPSATSYAPYVYADDNKMYSSADFDTNIEADLSGGGGGPMGGQTYGLKPFVTNRATGIQLDVVGLAPGLHILDIHSGGELWTRRRVIIE